MMAVRGPSLVEVEILVAPAGKGSLCANTIQTSETLPATIALAQSRRNGFAIDIRVHPLPGGMPSVIVTDRALAKAALNHPPHALMAKIDAIAIHHRAGACDHAHSVIVAVDDC
jgi:hypothetical protein